MRKANESGERDNSFILRGDYIPARLVESPAGGRLEDRAVLSHDPTGAIVDERDIAEMARCPAVLKAPRSSTVCGRGDRPEHSVVGRRGQSRMLVQEESIHRRDAAMLGVPRISSVGRSEDGSLVATHPPRLKIHERHASEVLVCSCRQRSPHGPAVGGLENRARVACRGEDTLVDRYDFLQTC